MLIRHSAREWKKINPSQSVKILYYFQMAIPISSVIKRTVTGSITNPTSKIYDSSQSIL